MLICHSFFGIESSVKKKKNNKKREMIIFATVGFQGFILQWLLLPAVDTLLFYRFIVFCVVEIFYTEILIFTDISTRSIKTIVPLVWAGQMKWSYRGFLWTVYYYCEKFLLLFDCELKCVKCYIWKTIYFLISRFNCSIYFPPGQILYT